MGPRLLLLETSGRVGQVAVAEGDALRAVRRLDEAQRHARDLAPAVAELLASEVSGDGDGERPSIDRELDRVEAMLASIAADDGERERLEARLRSFSARVQSFLSRRTEDTPDGGERKIGVGDVPAGRRAGKGQKVVKRGGVAALRRVAEEA